MSSYDDKQRLIQEKRKTRTWQIVYATRIMSSLSSDSDAVKRFSTSLGYLSDDELKSKMDKAHSMADELLRDVATDDADMHVECSPLESLRKRRR